MTPQLKNEERDPLTLGDIFRDICTRAGVTPDEEAIAKLGGHIETMGYLIGSVPPAPPETITVEEARQRLRTLGEYGEANFVSFGTEATKVDGTYCAADLRRIADLWDACHDAEGNER